MGGCGAPRKRSFVRGPDLATEAGRKGGIYIPAERRSFLRTAHSPPRPGAKAAPLGRRTVSNNSTVWVQLGRRRYVSWPASTLLWAGQIQTRRDCRFRAYSNDAFLHCGTASATLVELPVSLLEALAYERFQTRVRDPTRNARPFFSHRRASPHLAMRLAGPRTSARPGRDILGGERLDVKIPDNRHQSHSKGNGPLLSNRPGCCVPRRPLRSVRVAAVTLEFGSNLYRNRLV